MYERLYLFSLFSISGCPFCWLFVSCTLFYDLSLCFPLRILKSLSHAFLRCFRLSSHLSSFALDSMQTDPNWSNFLYDEATNSINLIDFGAARDYPKSFVDDYLRMVRSHCCIFS